jgi:hypothetical protein
MEQTAKKLRLALDNEEVLYLDAMDAMSFHFGDSDTTVKPEFVHQNFGQAGKIAWPSRFMPLKISVHVDTKNDLLCTISIEHGGDTSCPEAVFLREDLVSTIANPCDVMDGCKPACYPGDLTDKYSTKGSQRLTPSSLDELGGDLIVQRFTATDFAPKPFYLWKRAEWLMLWFIESVSQSQHETDTNWEYYLLRNTTGEIHAFASVYRFPSFSFLKEGVIGERIRLSQFLTIPSKWNGGFGSRLLSFIALRAANAKHTDKLTMEDPSLGMTSMRESVYLAMSKEAGLADPKLSVTVEAISRFCKVPTIFARRLRRLFELNKLRDGEAINDELVNRIATSDNIYVRKFIESIEFYDDEEEDQTDNTTGDVPANRKLSQEEMRAIIHKTVEEALTKLDKILTVRA